MDDFNDFEEELTLAENNFDEERTTIDDIGVDLGVGIGVGVDGPQRSQTMPNIASVSASFVDVHPILIETEINSSPKILNSVFEDREPEKNDKNNKNDKNENRVFHKNSNSVASAVNAWSKSQQN